MSADALIGVTVSIAQGACLILFAPVVVGFVRKFKAWLQLRQGPRILQPYSDLRKLWRKPPVRSGRSYLIFAAAPFILFCTYALLAFTVPIFSFLIAVRCDFIVIMYLLCFARFVTALAGLDAGASFTGLGSSREMFLSLLTEAGLILFIIALMIQWKTVVIKDVFGSHWNLGGSQLLHHPQLILLSLSLSLLILFECERIPIEKQGTHLELTMAQRAATLEHAGRDLALIEWAEMIKLTFMFTLLGGLFLPFPRAAAPAGGHDAAGMGFSLLIYIAKTLLILAPSLAIWELRRPKLRLRAVATTAFTSMVLSLLAIIYTTAVAAGR